eukprot:TRINITY_DN46915_c0_g1_i1.p1 TRINITY_DN46915_c0_g1~~TRINITY_DN46915_c0_g1_i1.p1  ORF type:complete len:991 (+),score=269.54 TRINITY_DN46915_c0_g1_i1:413-2974(+)
MDKRIDDVAASVKRATEAARSDASSLRSEMKAQLGDVANTAAASLSHLEGSLRADLGALGDKQLRATAEVQRLWQALEKRLDHARRSHDEFQQKVLRDSESWVSKEDLRQQLSPVRGKIELVDQARTRQAEEARVALLAAEERVGSSLAELRGPDYGKVEAAKSLSSLGAWLLEVQTAADENKRTSDDEHEAAKLRDVARRSEIAAALREIDAAKARAEELAQAQEETAKRLQETTDCGSHLETLADERFKEHASQLALLRSEASEACTELATTFGRKMEQLKRETLDGEAALRGDVERGLSMLHGSLETAKSSGREELYRQADDIRRGLEQLERQLGKDVSALQESLFEKELAFNRRAARFEDRLEATRGQVSEELSSALRVHHDNLEAFKESAESELKALVAKEEGRLRACVDEALTRSAELDRRLAELRHASDAATGHAQLTVDAALVEAQAARQDAAAAQRRHEEVQEELKSLGKQLEGATVARGACDVDFKVVAGALVAAVVKLAQCCGIISGMDSQDGGPDDSLGISGVPAGTLGLKELLAWERSGVPLFQRIHRAWRARMGEGVTLLGLLMRKVEAPELRMVQGAVRDLDARTHGLHSYFRRVLAEEGVHQGCTDAEEASLSPSRNPGPHLGEPFPVAFVGTYAANSQARRARAAGQAQESPTSSPAHAAPQRGQQHGPEGRGGGSGGGAVEVAWQSPPGWSQAGWQHSSLDVAGISTAAVTEYASRSLERQDSGTTLRTTSLAESALRCSSYYGRGEVGEQGGSFPDALQQISKDSKDSIDATDIDAAAASKRRQDRTCTPRSSRGEDGARPPAPTSARVRLRPATAINWRRPGVQQVSWTSSGS